ncbi:hypothetical protein THO17_11760 [Marinomonas sp. THO17]
MLIFWLVPMDLDPVSENCWGVTLGGVTQVKPVGVGSPTCIPGKETL